MQIRRKLARAATLGALLLSISGAASAVQLKENSADIQQVVNIPGMAIAINPGGTGCNAAKNEKWEPTQNGCSNVDWAKQSARVLSVVASPPSILANDSDGSTLVATVVDGNGNLVGAGIPTNWWTNSGWLTGTSTVTNASGQTAVVLRGTVAGVATVNAAAVAGGSGANVTLRPDASTARVVSLVPSPASVPADWTAAGLYATVRDAYSNILPAGQPVYLAASLGNLSTGTAYTDGNGVAYATIASGTAGASTVYAKTVVSGNVTTGVTFTASNAVINSFTVYANYAGRNYPNQIWFDSGNSLIISGIFNWSVTGADRYELWDSKIMLYSGTASTFSMTPYGQTYFGRITLKAFKGGAVTSMVITPDWNDQYCSGCGSGS